MILECNICGLDNNTVGYIREKISYSITDYGKETLEEWLGKPAEKDEIRYETLLKLFFRNENGFEGAMEHIIEAFCQRIKE